MQWTNRKVKDRSAFSHRRTYRLKGSKFPLCHHKGLSVWIESRQQEASVGSDKGLKLLSVLFVTLMKFLMTANHTGSKSGRAPVITTTSSSTSKLSARIGSSLAGLCWVWGTTSNNHNSSARYLALNGIAFTHSTTWVKVKPLGSCQIWNSASVRLIRRRLLNAKTSNG